MASEPDHLLAGGAVRRLERTAVRRTPDGLNHVPEVVAAETEAEIVVAHDEEQRERPASVAAESPSSQTCACGTRAERDGPRASERTGEDAIESVTEAGTRRTTPRERLSRAASATRGA